MSTDEQNVPPAGEEIHLPPGSLQPHAVTAGLTLGLVTLTSWPIVSAVGFLLMFWAMGLWIRDARREHLALPEHHGHDADGQAAADQSSSH
jgi:hypothetical protein